MPTESGPGETGDALKSARAALAAADARLAEADRLLAVAARTAHRVAADAVCRLAAVRADIDAAVDRRATDTPAAAQEFGRFLLAKNREIADIVAAARAEAAAQVTVLQAVHRDYRR